MKKAPAIAKARLQWRKADISIGKAGVVAMEVGQNPARYMVARSFDDVLKTME